MNIVKLPGYILEFYDSPNQLPIGKYYEYNFYLTLALNLSLENVNSYFSSLEGHIKSNETQKAIRQLHNIRTTFLISLSKVDIMSVCIGQLLYSINGEKVDYNLDEASLKSKMSELSKAGLTMAQVESIFEHSKKKFALA